MQSGPLLIGACPRSGTTALLQVLNTNSSVFISSEENLLRLTQAMEKNLGTRERRTRDVENGMRAISVRETLSLENIHSCNFSEESLWPVVRYIYKWHHKKLYDSEELILWGDKLPAYYKDLKSILSFPKVKYIHITRNPLDVINSMLRRTEMARQGKDWWKAITDFDDMLEAWKRAYNAICKAESNRKILHIHYEDLVFNFDDTISTINKFLGLDLVYKNIMVDEESCHYQRDYITQDQINIIFNDDVVQKYIKRRELNLL